jgi:flagellin
MAMGLRINTNVPALRALRAARLNDSALSRSLERLASGLRINRGADDPSGLVISEQLRAQINKLEQAVINSQDGSNLLATADAALQEVSDLLTQIGDSIVFAQNTGAASPDQILAEQEAVNQAIDAIDRIAATTRFADGALLNGARDYQLTETRPALLQNLKFRSVFFAPGQTDRTLIFTVTNNPQRPEIRISGVASAGTLPGTRLRVTGPRGTEDVTFASTANAMEMATAINAVAGFTGVYASGVAVGSSSNLNIFGEAFGSAQYIKIELMEGRVSTSPVVGGAGFYFRNDGDSAPLYTVAPVGPGLTAGEIVFDRGRDGQINFESQNFTGIGAHFSILNRLATLQFDLDPDLLPVTIGAPGATVSATVGNTGSAFQLRELSRPTDRIDVGIESMNTALLGFEPFRDRVTEATAGVSAMASAGDQILKGGFLNSIKTGGGNDLFQNPRNAGDILHAATDQVATLRGFLGAVVADALEPNIRSVNVEIENLSASLSTIRDLDFAEETTAFVRNQVLVQTSLSVLANAAAGPQAVLLLLQG